MKQSIAVASIAVLALLASAAPARAQGVVTSGQVSALVNEGDTSVAFSGSVGYRMNNVLTFGVELMRANGIEEEPDYGIYAAVLRPIFNNFDTDLTSFTTNVRLEVPTTTRRVIPFVVGGGGVAAVSREYPLYTILPYSSILEATRLSGVLEFPTQAFTPLVLGEQILPQGNYSDVSTSMVLTLGGGVSVMTNDHLSIDVDLRLIHLFEQSGSHSMGRFGVGVGYRF